MADTREKMTKEAAIAILRTELKYTDIDVDYAHDTADGKVELVPGQDIAHALIMAIAAMNEQPERAGRTAWIPVTEWLPRENEKVLAYRSFGDSHTVFLARRWDGKWVDAEWNCYRYGVTHWMPLPEPPKGG